MGAELNAGRVVIEIGAINNTGNVFKSVNTGLTGLENNFKKSGSTIKNSMGDSLKSVNSSMDQFGTKISKGLTTPFANIGSKISSALSSAKSSLISFASSAGSAFNGLVSAGQKVYDKIGLIGTMMVGVFTSKLKGAIVEATSVFMTFDDQMRKVQAVTESTGETFDTLTTQAKYLGATTSFTAQEAADAMTMLGQAGFNANEIFAAMPATLNLARGSMTDLATTADIMSNIMNGFQISAEDTTRVADVLSKAANATNTDVTGLGNAMKYVAPLAFQMGWSLEETASAAGLLSNAGIKSSMAGTVLRNAISRLLSPTAKAAGILESYGISLDAISPKTHSFAQIVELLTQKQVSAADIMQVFGMRAGPGMLAMMNIGTAAIQDMNKTLYDSAGYAQRAADMMDAGWGGVVRRLGDAAESLQISFGGAFAGILTPFAEIVSRIAVAISRLPAPIIYLGAALALVAVAAGATITALAALPMIAGVITAGMSVLAGGLTALAGAWGAMAGSATLGGIALGAATASMATIVVTVGGVVAAIAGLGLVLWEIEQKTQIFSKTWTFLKDSFTIASYVIGKTIEYLSIEIKKEVTNIIQWLTNLAEDTHLTAFVDTVTGVYEKVKSSLGKTADSVHESAENIRAEKERLAESEENVKKQIDRAHDGTVKSYETVDKATGQTYASMIENAEGVAEGVSAANNEIAASNTDLVTSNEALSASSPTVKFNIENSDISSIVDPTKGQAVVTNDALTEGIQLANGELLTYNESGQLVIQTLDGIQKRVYDLGNTKLETATGSKIWTMGGKVTDDNGNPVKISTEEALARTNAMFGDDKAKHTAGSGVKKDTQWQMQHTGDTMLYMNPDGSTGPYPGDRALREDELAAIKEGKWTKEIKSMRLSSTPISGEEMNKRVAADNKLYGGGELKPEGHDVDKNVKIKMGDGRELSYNDALKQQNGLDKLDNEAKTAWTPRKGAYTSDAKGFNTSWISKLLPKKTDKTTQFDKTKSQLSGFKLDDIWKPKSGAYTADGAKKATDGVNIFGKAVQWVNSLKLSDVTSGITGIGIASASTTTQTDEMGNSIQEKNYISISGILDQIKGLGTEADTTTGKSGLLSTALGLINSITLPNIQTEISNTAQKILGGITNSDLFKGAVNTWNSISFSGLLSAIAGVGTALGGIVTTAKSMYTQVSEYVSNAVNKYTSGTGTANKSTGYTDFEAQQRQAARNVSTNIKINNIINNGSKVAANMMKYATGK